MSDHFVASIEALQTDLRGLEEKVVKTKQLINMLAERAGIAVPYPDAELSVHSTITVSTDEFFNKPLFRCAKAFLSRRKAGLRPPGYERQFSKPGTDCKIYTYR